MADLPDNDTRRRILDVAEELFTKRGYTAVTLRDIAEVVKMKHASLYYYAPDGKEGLYIEVMQRNFERHRLGLTRSIEEAGSDLRRQVYAVSDWLVSQPPLDLTRLAQSDMPAIRPDAAANLMLQAYNALRIPIVGALKTAREQKLIGLEDLNLGAMALVSLVQSVHTIPDLPSLAARQEIGRSLAAMLLDGWRAR